jgi:hypothetical protein
LWWLNNSWATTWNYALTYMGNVFIIFVYEQRSSLLLDKNIECTQKMSFDAN